MEMLVQALSARYHNILDRSQNSRNEDTTRFTYGLTQLERSLFQAGYNAAHEQWKVRLPRALCKLAFLSLQLTRSLCLYSGNDETANGWNLSAP